MSWAIAGVVIAAVGAATAAASAITSGQQQQKASEANARFMEDQAKQAKHAAAIKAEQYRDEASRRMAMMRASYAYSGVETTEGTPLLTLMESASEAARDEERIRQTGEQTAWGLLSEANIARIGGRSAYTAGVMGAGSSLLGGAARIAAQYNK